MGPATVLHCTIDNVVPGYASPNQNNLLEPLFGGFQNIRIRFKEICLLFSRFKNALDLLDFIAFSKGKIWYV